MDVQDSTNITGIAKLMNYDGSKNLDKLEKSIIADHAIEEKDDNDEVDGYKKHLEELGSHIGVILDDEDISADSLLENTEENAEENTEDSNEFNDRFGDGFNNVDDIYDKVSNNPRTYFGKVTEEQKKQKILNHVLSEIEDPRFSVEKEKEEDDKAIILEQIDMLTTNLTDEGVDVSRIPKVDANSSLEEIRSIHKILRLKNDRNRYCSFAEECILAGSHSLEWLFDGEKNYMGRKPDLRGWSATVNIKLRRMRYDTSTFVSDVMQDYDLGHGTRIMLELIPSLFLYSKMKKSQYADNLITSDQMNDAMDRIRSVEDD